jgi:RNA polymerase sigma factor (sigma-70 family)
MRMVEAEVGADSASPAQDFAAWVEPHLTAMTRLAIRLAPVGDGVDQQSVDYQDIVQLALERAWKRRSTFDPERGSASSWLLAIVADQAQRARTRRKPRAVDPRPLTQEPPDPALDIAVRQLPSRQRMAVELHYFLGLPVRECAEVLGVAEGTIKSALSDARAKLRTLLEVRDA